MSIRSLKSICALIGLILISSCQAGDVLPTATMLSTAGSMAVATKLPAQTPTDMPTGTATATSFPSPTPWPTATAGPTPVGGSEEIMFTIARRMGESYQYLGVYNFNRLLSHVDTIFAEGYNLQAVSPDGRWILVNQGSRLFLAGRYGSYPVTLSEYFYEQSLTPALWSEDGQQIWWIENKAGKLSVMYSTFYGDDIRLAAPELQEQTVQLLQVENERAFAWLKGSCNSGSLCQGEVWLKNDQSAAVSSWGQTSNPIFDQTLTRLAFSTQVDSGAALTIKTDSNPTEGILVDMEGNIPVDYAWSPDGNTLIAIDQIRSDYSGKNLGNNILYMTAPDWKAEIIPGLAGINARLTWSLDGKWVLFSSTLAGEDGYHLQLALFDLATKKVQVLNLPFDTLSSDYIFIPQIFWLPG